MKIYFAARMGRKAEIERYASHMRSRGANVVSKWHTPGNHAMNDAADDCERHDFAIDDLESVESANVLIVFTEDPKTAHTLSIMSYGGRFVELGYCLGLNKRRVAPAIIVIIGPHENVFVYLRGVKRYSRWNDFLQAFDAGSSGWKAYAAL